jgi:hypothetical protein
MIAEVYCQANVTSANDPRKLGTGVKKDISRGISCMENGENPVS